MGAAEKLVAAKAEIDRAQDKYRKLLFEGGDLSARADALGPLSATLGTTSTLAPGTCSRQATFAILAPNKRLHRPPGDLRFPPV